jgi:hypothetical protein
MQIPQISAPSKSSFFLYPKNSNKNFYFIFLQRIKTHWHFAITSSMISPTSIPLNSTFQQHHEYIGGGHKEEEMLEEDEDSILPHFQDNARLFLYLRYYARHFIPIFCIVGIIGNCMALLLIRQVWPQRN